MRASRRTQSGQALPIMAALMIGIIGITALVTDVGAYFSENRVQQNAAEAASHAATTYWAANFTTATDHDLYCLTQLYSSAAAYVQINGCPAVTSVPDNQGRGTIAYYVDFSGTPLPAAAPLPLGRLDTQKPALVYPTAAGIQVRTTAVSGAFFSRIFNVTGLPVNDVATNRIGTVGSVTGAERMLPAAFQLSTYRALTRYPPSADPATATRAFFLDAPCNPTGAFCWSGLQCSASNSNADVKSWLNGLNPCPAQASTLAVAGSAMCAASPPAACSVSANPGLRATDFQLVASLWAGAVVMVPVIDGAGSSNPIVQFAYFHVTGADGTGNPKTINGFFVDPALMPPLPGALIGPGCNPIAPCGVGGI